MTANVTATMSAPIYSIRDDAGRLLASGEYMPSVQDAAYNKACVLNPDRSTTTFTYYINGEPGARLCRSLVPLPPPSCNRPVWGPLGRKS